MKTRLHLSWPRYSFLFIAIVYHFGLFGQDCPCNHIIPDGALQSAPTLYLGSNAGSVAAAGTFSMYYALPACWSNWLAGATPHTFVTVNDQDGFTYPPPAMPSNFGAVTLDSPSGTIGDQIVCIGNDESIFTQLNNQLQLIEDPNVNYTLNFQCMWPGVAGTSSTLNFGFSSIPVNWEDRAQIETILTFNIAAGQLVLDWQNFTQSLVLTNNTAYQFLYVWQDYSGLQGNLFFLDNLSIVRTCLATEGPIALTQNNYAICLNELDPFTTTITNIPTEHACAIVVDPMTGVTLDGLNITIDPSVGITEYVVSTTYDCLDPTTITIEYNAAPALNLEFDPVICSNELMIINLGNNQVEYVLNPQAENTVISGNAIAMNLESSETFVIQGTDQNGCLTEENVSIQVNTAPTIANLNGGLEYCANEIPQLLYSNSYGNSLSVFPTTNLLNLSNQIFTTSQVSTAYTFTLLGDNGCQTSEQVQVVVQQVPVLNGVTGNAIDGFCNAALAINPALGAPWTYSWTMNGSPIANANNTYLTSACGGNIYQISAFNAVTGCTSEFSFYPINVPMPEFTITENEACYEGCNGSQTITSDNLFRVNNGPWVYTYTTTEGCPGNYIVNIQFQGYPTFPYTYNIVEETVDAVYNAGNPYATVTGYVFVPIGVTYVFDQDIIIAATGVLNLNAGNITFKFTPGHGIIIEPGGKLLGSVATFTHTCNDWWNGIVAKGAPLGARALVSLTKSSVIEYALTGFKNHYNNLNYGGKISASETIFRNNDRDVTIENYTALTVDYGASFLSCQFLVNDDALAPVQANNTRVYLNKIGRVKFSLCTMSNTNADLLFADYMRAIVASEATINYTGTSNIPLVSGFDLGFHLTNPSTANYIITGTKFQCHRGVYLRNTRNAIISKNTFTNLLPGMVPNMAAIDNGNLDGVNGNESGSYGIYSYWNDNMLINENTINMNIDPNRFGIIMFSNPKINFIYNNTIYNQGVAIASWGRNKDATFIEKGLKIRCNTFYPATILPENINENDILVTNPTNSPNAGIAWTQSGGTPAQNVTGLSAGNKFVHLSGDLEWDDIFDNTQVGHRYLYHNTEGLDLSGTPVYQGQYYTEGEFWNTPVPTPVLVPFSCSFYNPPINTTSFNPANLSLVLDEISNLTSSKENIKNEWLTLVDGGQTEVLKSEVVLADLSDCFDLYSELHSQSPALSEEVMLEAIDKVYDFPASLLTAILQANPSSAKNQRILEALENRVEPLTDVQLFLIKQGVDITSLKEQLELEMALIEEARCSAITEGLAYLSGIEDEGDYSAQMHQLQTMEFSPSDAYSALDYLIATGQNSDILSKFDLIAQNYTLTEWQANENSALRDLHELEAGSNYTYNFSASELNMLENNVDSKFDAVALKATKLLSMQDPSFTNDPIFESAAAGYRSEQLTTVREEENQIKVYPNPVVESVIVELPAVGHYHRFTLVDQLGQLILDGTIPDQSQVFTISVGHLAAGNYVLTLQGRETKTGINTTIVKQ